MGPFQGILKKACKNTSGGISATAGVKLACVFFRGWKSSSNSCNDSHTALHQQKWARQTWTRYLRDSSPASSYDSVSIGVWQPWLSPFRRDDAAPNDGVIIHAVIFPVKGFLNKVFAILICMDMVCRSRKYYSPGFCRLFCGKSFSDGRFFWIALVLYAGNTKIICQRKATAAQWVFGSYNLSLPNSPAKKKRSAGARKSRHLRSYLKGRLESKHMDLPSKAVRATDQ